MTRQEILGLIGLSLFSFTGFLDYTIVNLALPYIQASFSMSVVKLQWIITVYYIVNAALMATMGKLGDMFGLKKLLLIGMIGFVIASLVCGLAVNANMLIVGRALQGITAAMLFPLSATALSLFIRDQYRTQAMSIFSTANGVGIAAGPTVGGLLIAWFNWRWVFYINIPLVLVGIYFCVRYVKFEQHRHAVKIDYWGMLFLFLFITAVTLGVTYGAENGWLQARALLYFAVSVVSLVLLVMIEKKAAEPLIRFEFFKKPLFFLGVLSCAACGIAIGIILFFVPLYLNDIKDYSPMVAGLVLFAIPLMTLILPMSVPLLLRLGSTGMVMVLGFLAFFLSTLLISFFDVHSSLVYIVIALILAGTGWGLEMAMVTLAVQNAIAKEFHGVGTGMAYSMFNVAGSIFLAVTVSVFHVIENHQAQHMLQQFSISLSAFQQQALKNLLSDPNRLSIILKDFGQQTQHIIMSVFQHSFLFGMQIAMWIISVALLWMIWFSVRLLKKGQ